MDRMDDDLDKVNDQRDQLKAKFSEGKEMTAPKIRQVR